MRQMNLVSVSCFLSLALATAPAWSRIGAGVQEGSSTAVWHAAPKANPPSTPPVQYVTLTADNTGYTGLTGENIPTITPVQPDLSIKGFKSVSFQYLPTTTDAVNQLTVVLQTNDGYFHVIKGTDSVQQVTISSKNYNVFLYTTGTDLTKWNPPILTTSTASQEAKQAAIVYSGGPGVATTTINLLKETKIDGTSGGNVNGPASLNTSPDTKFNFEP